MSIPDKAVEVGSQAFWEYQSADAESLGPWPPSEAESDDAELTRRFVRIVLEAAEPYLTGRLEREDLEAEIKDALEDLGIVAYPTNARNDAEEPVEVGCVAGHVAGYILALQRSDVKS